MNTLNGFVVLQMPMEEVFSLARMMQEKLFHLENAKRLLEDVPNKVRDTLGILVDVKLHDTVKGDYIEIIVEPHPYPVNYKGQYHYRSGTTKQELKGAALDKFLLQRKGKRWDGVPIPNISVA